MDKEKILREYSLESIENLIGSKVCTYEFPKNYITDNETLDLSAFKIKAYLGSYDFEDQGREETYLIKYNDFYYFLRIPMESAYKFNMYDASTLNDVLKTSISISLLPCLIPLNNKGKILFTYLNGVNNQLHKKYSCSIDLFNDINWVLKILKCEK